eukprot:TRINITY_DN11379_c0_g1_i2.p1 TRINITY_DN11379_c0_g1~~TRINITY_DN11379_c0_g1_i2.p1  ORF type:complete len:159 (-),score=38.98 TRINITY_DN11379_c0_g1_i2:78-503(-)
MATKATEGGVAGHEEAQSADLATAFMMFVRRCPGVTRSIQEFVVENAPAFASLGESDEHSHEHQAIFQRYIALLDGHVESFLKFKGASEEEFMQTLVQVRDSGEVEWRPFKALLDKADYYTFAKMMQIQANGIGPQGGAPA